MQNLGFAPDLGVSELYSYYTQIDPLLLSQAEPAHSGASSLGQT